MPQSCSAARAGEASLFASFFPFAKFDISFIGTGTAEFPSNIDFNLKKNEEQVQMEWTKNRFIGSHWLLGDFKIDLNPTQKSIGRVENFEMINERVQALNTNEFYFKFSFPRFNNLIIFNDQPIVNSSLIFDIPPTKESEYKLSEESKSLKATFSDVKSMGIKFNFCTISLFPEQNILTEVVEITKIDKKTYNVSVKYSNLTKLKVTCAYFLVLHDKDLITENDFGFKKVKGEESFIINYVISHKLENISVELPIFGGIYLPKNLRGSNQKIITLEF